MKILKEEFDSLYDENISKKEYERILSKIDQRFIEIVDEIKQKKIRITKKKNI